jgi:GT2 family glycosyltransferase
VSSEESCLGLPIISVIVVNYNGSDHISECLHALVADTISPESEILVVDNASTDNSISIIKHIAANLPSVQLISSDFNRGYPGGINLGLSRAKGRYIAILNMDTFVKPGWLCEPVAFLEANASAGAVSPLLVLYEDEFRVNAIGQNVHVTGLGFNRGLGIDREKIGDTPIAVSGIHGAAFVTRKEIMDQIGGLDENPFLYHEDVDFSWLLLLMGFDLYCLPKSTVCHKYFLTMYPEKLYLLERNRVFMLLSHLDYLSTFILFPLLLFTEFLMWSYCLLRGTGFLKAKAQSYFWLINQRHHLKERKKFLQTLRERSDWQVLQKLSWNYAWDQFLVLGRERGISRRQPSGGIPIPASEERQQNIK